ncbi:MAG TPA: hypothetical protein VN026_08500 [Bacteroidia bacterium]|jgi:hypothetical protein|nr:hypothetical protein [Bacteroidia bacterium]
METDFKGIVWLEHKNEFKRYNNFGTIESVENVNTQNDAVGRSPIVKSNKPNFFVLAIDLTVYWFIDKKELSNTMVDKLELFNRYSFEIETHNGNLFKDTASNDAINCWNILLTKCYVKIKEYSDSKLGKDSYKIPPESVILTFARTLGMNEVN